MDKRPCHSARILLRLAFNDRIACNWNPKNPSSVQGAGNVKNITERNGAQERTRTSTPVRALAPEASASTNSATWAGRRNAPVFVSCSVVKLRWRTGENLRVHDGRGAPLCSLGPAYTMLMSDGREPRRANPLNLLCFQSFGAKPAWQEAARLSLALFGQTVS